MDYRILFILCLIQLECSTPGAKKADPELTPEVTNRTDILPIPSLSREILYDKVLGMLLGSAIGDAMGAPTEMWSRSDIWINYGFVDDLDTMVREPSAEGTWDYNLPAGGTTDDTRWKKLVAEYLLTQGSLPDDREFAQYIVRNYQSEIDELKNVEGFSPESYETKLREMAWLQEWALVAKPFAQSDLLEYSYALNRFYGGEMTCAGMLYAPVIGAYFPGNPDLAYQETYKLSIFDLGYARDISGLTGAMVSASMAEGATKNSVLEVLRDVDPNDYFKSRLVGRSSYRIFKEAKYIVHEANLIQEKDIDVSAITFPIPPKADTLFLARVQKAYQLMDTKLQDLPFHPAEIHLVNLTALLLCDMDFEKSLSFIINFGRDNDTTGAVAGAILGAFWGAEKLPSEMTQRVITANKSLGIDIEALAANLADKILENGNS